MKKLAIIGFSFVLLLIIATLFFWQHQKHPTDSAIRDKLIGTWSPNIADGRVRTSTMYSDGHWTATVTGKIGTGRMDGTWHIKDGFWITTMTNNDLDMQVPSTNSSRIIRIDNHEFIVSNRQMQVVYKKIEP
jgi:hypothetical protein